MLFVHVMAVLHGSCAAALTHCLHKHAYSFDESGPAFKQLPPPVKAAIVDIGICHYLVLVKAPDGRVLQLDFGPCGGDVHVSVPGARLSRALSTPTLVMPTSPLELEPGAVGSPGEPVPGVPGEVRERWLSELPSHMPLVHVGRTSRSLQEIREFNQQQPTYYLLHDNDCRHFANNLVQHMTGMHKATAVFLRQQVCFGRGSLGGRAQ